MKSRSIFILSILSLFIIAGSFVMADNNSSVSTPKNWTLVCSKINEIVSQKIQAFDEGNVRRINAYNNTENMIQKMIEKLNEKGADTTQAETDYQDLQAKVSQFNIDYSSFIIKLEGLKAYSCGNSSGQFAQSLRDAKSFLPTLRNDSIQIRETFMKIKLDLVQAREDLLTSRLGEKANKTQENYQKRISQVKNRTARVEDRIQNRISQIGNRISKLENRTQK